MASQCVITLHSASSTFHAQSYNCSWNHRRRNGVARWLLPEAMRTVASPTRHFQSGTDTVTLTVVQCTCTHEECREMLYFAATLVALVVLVVVLTTPEYDERHDDDSSRNAD